MRITVRGLIIAETIIKESDKYLTVLTENFGKISVYAPHVRNIKRGHIPISTPLQYCRLILNKKTDTFTLCDGDVLYSFLNLQDDLTSFALSQYVLDVAREITVEGESCNDILRLVLNTLYIIQKGTKPFLQVKGVFELRMMAKNGYLPDISSCRNCGSVDSDTMFFDIMNGSIICRECKNVHLHRDKELNEDLGTAVIICPLTESVLNAMRYVLEADDKKIFSFTLEENSVKEFSSVCEKYILNHLERSFNSLEFFWDVSAI